MGWYWIVLIVLLAVALIYCLFIFAEWLELQRITSIFMTFERNLVSHLDREKNTLSHDGVTFGMVPAETIQGAGYAVQRMLRSLTEEEGRLDTISRHAFKSIRTKLRFKRKYRGMV